MKASTVSIHPNVLRNAFAAALTIGALTVVNIRAHASELDPITVSPPVEKKVGRDLLTLAPVEDVTVKAQIAVDTETLQNDSGVVLLKDRVLEAANKVCAKADPVTMDDGTCVRDAMKAAQPQVDAAIANARKPAAMS